MLAPQDARARRVERQDPHALGDAAADQSLDAIGHLAGGLVRERDRQDRPGIHAELADQVRDAVRQRARLPRAGPGHDEDRPLRVEDGLGLDVVQAFEQGGADAHEPIVGALGDRPGRDARRAPLGPGYAGCIVNAEATLPRAQTATPRPRRPLSVADPQVVRDRLLDGGRRPRRLHRLAALGHRSHHEGRAERAEAGLHPGHRHEGSGAGAPCGCRAAPRVGVRGAADPADRPRPDRRAGDGRGVAQEGPGHYPDTADPGTPPGASASPATAPRISRRSTAWMPSR